MFCGNAAGQFMPPMVVYKANHVYAEWCKDGPDGALYACTASGWFDSPTFYTWFFNIFLEEVKEKPDNLAAHFSYEVIQACEENDIALITLPSNATHLCQPLDVGCFGPAKRVWKVLLECWRLVTRSKGTIPKQVLPLLLKKLVSSIKEGHLLGVTGTRTISH